MVLVYAGRPRTASGRWTAARGGLQWTGGIEWPVPIGEWRGKDSGRPLLALRAASSQAVSQSPCWRCGLPVLIVPRHSPLTTNHSPRHPREGLAVDTTKQITVF